MLDTLEAKLYSLYGIKVVSAEIAGAVVKWLADGYTTEDILEAARELKSRKDN